MSAVTINHEKLDPRVMAGKAVSLELDALNEELPVTVWRGDSWVEVIAVVENIIWVGGKPRPAIGLITARES
jgi:hypothetical protein